MAFLRREARRGVNPLVGGRGWYRGMGVGATHAKIAPFFSRGCLFPGRIWRAISRCARRLFFSLPDRPIPPLSLILPFLAPSLRGRGRRTGWASPVQRRHPPSGLTDSSGASNNVASQAFRVHHTPLSASTTFQPPRFSAAPSSSVESGVDGGGKRGCDGWRDKAGKTDGVKNEARARVERRRRGAEGPGENVNRGKIPTRGGAERRKREER